MLRRFPCYIPKTAIPFRPLAFPMRVSVPEATTASSTSLRILQRATQQQHHQILRPTNLQPKLQQMLQPISRRKNPPADAPVDPLHLPLEPPKIPLRRQPELRPLTRQSLILEVPLRRQPELQPCTPQLLTPEVPRAFQLHHQHLRQLNLNTLRP